MRLFIFESEANTGLGLRAFAGDAAGRKLPDSLVPGGKLVRSIRERTSDQCAVMSMSARAARGFREFLTSGRLRHDAGGARDP